MTQLAIDILVNIGTIFFFHRYIHRFYLVLNLSFILLTISTL